MHKVGFIIAVSISCCVIIINLLRDGPFDFRGGGAGGWIVWGVTVSFLLLDNQVIFSAGWKPEYFSGQSENNFCFCNHRNIFNR